MTHPVFRHGVPVAGALLSLTIIPAADAKKDVQLPTPTISVVGVDNVCDGFNVTTDSAGNTTLTCVPTGNNPNPNPNPGAPQGCAATVNGKSGGDTLTNAGGNAALNVTCTSPTSGLAYNWSRNGTANASTQQSWTDTPAANPALGPNLSATTDKTTSYQVQVCNGASCAIVPGSPLTVVVPKQGGTAPDPSWNGVCAGFNKTVVIPINWNGPQRVFTKDFGGFGANDVVVVQFTTGNVSTTTSLVKLSGAEYQASPSNRIAALSEKPCDFGPQAAPGAYTWTPVQSVTMFFALGTGSGFGYYPTLQLGKTYYLNVQNAPNSTCTQGGVCEMFFDLGKFGNL